ncbi:LRMP protein, partial [Onychorhynchus coronatus]|nr:LRMP protein [Onychorhynchus coronatus]
CSPYCFGSQEANTQNKPRALSKVGSKDVWRKQTYLTSTPNLRFFRSEKKTDSAGIQPPVPRAFALSERGKKTPKPPTFFLLEKGTFRNFRARENSSQFPPKHKDVSMDLETYRAVMGEWIEDCKRKWEDSATEESSASVEDLELQAPKNISEAKKTHVWMNVTSGSLEAFGGDVSKGDLETSDLITCVADLQYKTHKLQEENNKLKLILEAADETSNKLLADNEHLHQQIKSIQHYVLKAKSLEEELEEARNNLNLSEEKREQVLWQNKQLEKENQSLNIKVSSLQEENIRNSMDTDGLQKKILELSKNAAELQMQVNLYESTVVNKEASLVQKEQDIKELKLTVVECSSIIETLRAEKNKLLENMQHMQEELISNGLCFPLLCKYNSNVPEGMNSLHCELQLAQSSEIMKTEWTTLDETLDRDVLLLLQGPEYGGEKFKTLMQNLVSGRAYVN